MKDADKKAIELRKLILLTDRFDGSKTLYVLYPLNAGSKSFCWYNLSNYPPEEAVEFCTQNNPWHKNHNPNNSLDEEVLKYPPYWSWGLKFRGDYPVKTNNWKSIGIALGTVSEEEYAKRLAYVKKFKEDYGY